MQTPQVFDFFVITLSGYFIMYWLGLYRTAKKGDSSSHFLRSITHGKGIQLILLVLMAVLVAVNYLAAYARLFLLALAACGLYDIIVECFLLASSDNMKTKKIWEKNQERINSEENVLPQYGNPEEDVPQRSNQIEEDVLPQHSSLKEEDVLPQQSSPKEEDVLLQQSNPKEEDVLPQWQTYNSGKQTQDPYRSFY